jgi:hypothetical protein
MAYEVVEEEHDVAEVAHDVADAEFARSACRPSIGYPICRKLLLHLRQYRPSMAINKKPHRCGFVLP